MTTVDRAHSLAARAQKAESCSAFGLPAYAALLKSQHCAFEGEFRAIVASLPIRPDDCVLDLACGDGAYARWLAEFGTNVLAVDVSRPFLELAQRDLPDSLRPDRVRFVRGDFRRLPLDDASFDFVWCAQSLYSLPDPLEALRIMGQKTRPGGFVAVIENDEFHHVLLPWPIEIELALCQAQLVANIERSSKPTKFYVGRRLNALFHDAGLTDCRRRTWTFDRQAPLESSEREYFASHLRDLGELVRPHLTSDVRNEFERLSCPESNSYMLDSPDFSATCVNYVISGMRPREDS